MDQTIGITFMPKGEDKVFAVIDKLSLKIEQFVSASSGLGTMLSTINEATSKLTGLGTQFSQSVGGMTRSVKDFGKESKAAIGDVSRSMKDLGKTSGVLPAGGKRKGGAWFGPIGEMGALPMILRWKAYSEALRGAHALIDDIAMAGSRKQIMPELRDIAVVGFDKGQRLRTEEMGREHIRQWWSTGKQKDYLAAVAEAGSAFDVNSPMFKGKGVEELNKMAQSAMILGGASKLKGEQASKLLQNLVHAQMGFMKPEETAKYEQGIKRVSDLAEASAGKVATVIQKTSIWGPDVGYLMQYALPSALMKGWDIETLMAIGGLGRTTGFKGQQMGRALREIMEGEAGNFAKLAMAGSSDQALASKFLSLSGAQKKQMAQALTPLMNKSMGAAPFDFFTDVGKWLETAEKRGIDPVKGLGISKSWVGIIRTMGQQQFIKDWREKTGMLREMKDTGEAQKLLAGQQQDPGWWKDRLSNAWEGFTQSWSMSSPMGKTINSYVDFLDQMADLNKGAVGWNWTTAAVETKDFLVHGAAFGTLQTIIDASAGLAKALGTVPESYKPAQVEELWQSVTRLPDKLQSMVDSAGAFFDKLDKALEGPARIFAEATGKLNPRNWDIGSFMAAAVTPGPGLTPIGDVFAGLMPPGAIPQIPPLSGQQAAGQSTPSAGEPEPKHITIEVPVLLDGREIGRAAAEYAQERHTLAGGVYGD